MHTLLADPNPRSADLLATAIQMHWPTADVHHVTSSTAALHTLFHHPPDMAILAIDLPGTPAADVLSQIRRHSDLPVFMLCDEPDELREIHMLQRGADGCLTRSLAPMVVVARIETVLRRVSALAHGEDHTDFVCGDFVISYRNGYGMVAGEIVDLSPTEFRLLATMTRNAGRVITHRGLIDKVWGIDSHAGVEQLKVVMSRMRTKLKQAGVQCPIETFRGVGYRIVMPTPGMIELHEHVPVGVGSV